MNMVTDAGKTAQVKTMLYDLTKDEVLRIIPNVEDPEILYLYTYNYNWDNGFEIPQAIISSDKCTLSTALLLFYRADGASYLLEKSVNGNFSPWSKFIEKLYDGILDNEFRTGEIEFNVPLSKTQLYKIKKGLLEKETVFVEHIEGRNWDIDV